MEQINPAQPDFRNRWTLLNYEFHLRIIASSHRKRLTRIVGTLRSTVEPYVGVEIDLAELSRLPHLSGSSPT